MTSIKGAFIKNIQTPNMIELLLTCISGLGTIFGGLLVLYLNPSSNSAFGDLQACCAGVMIAISILLILEGLQVLDLISFTIYFFAGFLSLYILNYLLKVLLPQSSSLESSFEEKKDDDITTLEVLLPQDPHRREYSRVGLICFVSMFFHNLPEGISVALSAKKNLSLGVELAVAIFFHNVLEGMVVALPIWYESKSRYQVILWTFLNGAAEPLGVLLCWFVIPFSADVIPKVLTAVAGLMISLSLVELLPHSIGSSSIMKSMVFLSLGFLGGAVVMFITKEWINYAS